MGAQRDRSFLYTPMVERDFSLTQIIFEYARESTTDDRGNLMINITTRIILAAKYISLSRVVGIK